MNVAVVKNNTENTEEVVTWLEMHAYSDLKAAEVSHTAPEIRQVTTDTGTTGRRLYIQTGTDWHWVDRLGWSDRQWEDRYRQESVSLWVCRDGENAAGYFELQKHPDNTVEIVYFGLTPGYIGRGYGGFLLTRAVEEAWRLSPVRVWVHTSSRDHRHALENYLARGFSIYKTETVNVAG